MDEGGVLLNRYQLERIPLTYNFDPDKWYDDALAFLTSRLAAGRITRKDFDREQDLLDRKLEAMWQRLDGTYRIDLKEGPPGADKQNP